MYFLVGSAIVDRDDLTLYEKMACVVLARYTGQDAFHDLLTVEVVARKMSTSVENARKALEGLVAKGMILKESAERITQESEAPKEQVSKGAQLAPAVQVSPAVFESFDRPKAEITSDQLLEIFDEVMTKRQVLILFELAGRDLEVLKSAYHQVKQTHPFDMVDALSEYLQRDVAPRQPSAASESSAPSEPPLKEAEAEALLSQLEKPKTQVNLSRIHALYQQQKGMK